mmetsp:Transcript_4405/g.13354  ORF Transcript_4405/g.13354 Transcript_4405/m.13354 type:complete len:140 (-) Transcript_4405:374-793(-)
MAFVGVPGWTGVGKERALVARRPTSTVVRMGLPLELLAGDDQCGSRWLKTAPPPVKREFSLTMPRGGRKQKKADRIRAEADRFGKYMVLRRQLAPWSEYFRETYGRIPSLRDVRESKVPGLLEKFQEYVEIRNYFWSKE